MSAQFVTYIIVLIFYECNGNIVCQDVLNEATTNRLFIEYGDIKVKLNQLIDKEIASSVPDDIKWKGSDDDESRYTILMVDPDAPDPNHPIMSEWLHWLVVNIQASYDNINSQDTTTIMEYNGPTPPIGTHRYCIYVFKQNNGFNPSLADLQISQRANFNTQQFLNSDGNDLVLVSATKFQSSQTANFLN